MSFLLRHFMVSAPRILVLNFEPTCQLYCIHTKKLSCLSCLKSGVEFDMNDILYEFKNLHHF